MLGLHQCSRYSLIDFTAMFVILHYRSLAMKCRLSVIGNIFFCEVFRNTRNWLQISRFIW